MLLSVFTRHSTSCRFSRDRACRRCNCPKRVGGQVTGRDKLHQAIRAVKAGGSHERCLTLLGEQIDVGPSGD